MTLQRESAVTTKNHRLMQTEVLCLHTSCWDSSHNVFDVIAQITRAMLLRYVHGRVRFGDWAQGAAPMCCYELLPNVVPPQGAAAAAAGCCCWQSSIHAQRSNQAIIPNHM